MSRMAEPRPAEPLPTARSKTDGNTCSSDLVTAESSARRQEGGNAATDFRPIGPTAHVVTVAMATPTIGEAAVANNHPPQMKLQPRAEPIHPVAIPSAELGTLHQLRPHEWNRRPAMLDGRAPLSPSSRGNDLVPVALEECGEKIAPTNDNKSLYTEIVTEVKGPQAELWWQRWVPSPIRDFWCCCTADGAEVVEDLPRNFPAGPPLPVIDGQGRKPCHNEPTALQSDHSKSGINNSRGRIVTHLGRKLGDADVHVVNGEAHPSHSSGRAGQNGPRDPDGTHLVTRSGARPRPADADAVDGKACPSQRGAKAGQNGSGDVYCKDRFTQHRPKPLQVEAALKCRSVQDLPLASSRSKSSVDSSQAVPAAPPSTPRFSISPRLGIPRRGLSRRRDGSATISRQ